MAPRISLHTPQAHEAALAGLISQHEAALTDLRNKASMRESELQSQATKLEGANASLAKAKAALEEEGQVRSRQPSAIC